MTKQEWEAAHEFWNQLREWLRNICATERLKYAEKSPNEVELRTQGGRALHVEFDPNNNLRPLKYTLEPGPQVELQFVLAEKAYFRFCGVNYPPATLGREMLRDLRAE
jgi:hypothetical protein